MRIKTLAVGVLLAGLAVTATPVGALQPLVAGWELYFKLDWQAAERNGRPVVQGHIYNDYGFIAMNVRLLVQGLDTAGNVVIEKVDWLGGQVPPGTTAPFEVAMARSAPTYRVAVFAFTWFQSDGGGGSG